jgi:hypothetical protein
MAIAIRTVSTVIRLKKDRMYISLTKEEPQVEANDNHDNAKQTWSCQTGADCHIPKHNAELLVRK